MAHAEYFNGDQQAENDAYEANAPYDYVTEANAGMVESQSTLNAEARAQDRADAAWHDAKANGATDEEAAAIHEATFWA
jgi:hypothetical protein